MTLQLLKSTKKCVSLALCLLLTACVTDIYEPTPAPNPDGETTNGIPDDFDYSTVTSTNLTVKVEDVLNGKYYYLVEVFDANPVFNADAKLLAKGVANIKQNFVYDFDLAQIVKTIYIRQTDPYQRKVVQSLPVTSANLICDFNPSPVLESLQLRSETKAPTGSSTVPSDAIKLTNDKVFTKEDAYSNFWIPKDMEITGVKTFNGIPIFLYVEGTLDVASLDMSNGGYLYVLNGGNVNIDGTCIAESSKGIIHNYGNMTIAGDLTLSEGMTVVNKANGKLKIGGNFNLNEATLANECFIEIVNEFRCTGTVSSSASTLIKCGMLITQDAKITLRPNAILDADKAFYKKDLRGQGNANSGSSIKGVESDYSLYRTKEVKTETGARTMHYQGNLMIEWENHPNDEFTDNGNVRWAEQGKHVLEISGGDCNNEGNQVPPADAGDIEFPIEIPEGTLHTFIMEDNWPELGDYDMNDMVLGVARTMYGDEKNGILGVTFSLDVIAAGAMKQLGAGIQLDAVAANQVRSVKNQRGTYTDYFSPGGNGVEGSSKAVIPLFDNIHGLFGLSEKKITNTYTSSTYIVGGNIVIDVLFTSSIPSKDVAISNMNFFIVSGGNSTARTEVHLAGYAPTDKVKGDTHKYKSNDNMMWGMMIPAEFNYPEEGKKISDAYPQFENWAHSGGKEHAGWYQHPTTEKGYIFHNSNKPQ